MSSTVKAIWADISAGATDVIVVTPGALTHGFAEYCHSRKARVLPLQMPQTAVGALNAVHPLMMGHALSS